MAAMFSEKAQSVLNFLQGTDGDITTDDIMEAVGIADKRSVTGVLNGLQKKGLIVREVSAEDSKVKFIRLTPEGKSVDPMAEKAPKAE